MSSVLSSQSPAEKLRQHRRVAVALTAILLFLVMSICSPVRAATLPPSFSETTLASGLVNPTAMAFSPDGRLFVCQQGGQLRVIKNGALLATPFVTVTTNSSGERGLLGIAFDPNFATNQFLYVYYTATTPAIHNRVSRFTASVGNPDVAAAGSEVVIFELDNLSGATNHNGGAIHFGPDGKLYVAVGENANPANAQSLGNVLGKLLRINSDGTIPADNPNSFPGILGSPSGNNRAIWTVGLRNPYTFTFQPGSGRMFINDVGQNAWEEINDGIAGSNYGWSNCEGFCSPPNANFRDPLFEYGHGSSATTGCAITGGAFYNPTTTMFPADYVGKYFFAEFCTGWIRRFDPGTGTSVPFASGISGPVDLIVTNDGSLYYLARGSGSVFRVQSSAPTAANGNVSGTILDSNGNPVEGAAVRMNGTQNRLTVTDANGYYHFENVETDGIYTIVPSRANFNFTPMQKSFSQQGAHTEAVFNGQYNGGTANPLDRTEYFVRQQYVDFLNREPDEAGLNFWVNSIATCGGDSDCLTSKRTETSAAFFQSIEFQQTGYLVYRMYQSAYGDMPDAPVPVRLGEFKPDSQAIGFGVIVNAEDWQSKLEANKVMFAESFVQRAKFAQAYPTSLTPDQFVDLLFLHAGVTPDGADRAAAIAEFSSIGNTADVAARGRALRKVAENSTLRQQEFNQAFVLMQYFGYLRRDPNTGPDTDYSGYSFWLNKLESFNGNYGDAEMVKAFLVAGEYRQRFPK